MKAFLRCSGSDKSFRPRFHRSHLTTEMSLEFSACLKQEPPALQHMPRARQEGKASPPYVQGTGNILLPLPPSACTEGRLAGALEEPEPSKKHLLVMPVECQLRGS